VVGERPANADVDGLLADRDVQEARQLTRPEAFLDLLLEAPDQEHFPEEFAQRLFGDPAALFDFRHGPDSTLRGMPLEGFPKIWPEPPAGPRSGLLSTQFRGIESELPADWRSARLRLTVPDAADCGRAAALLGPANPRRRGKALRFPQARRGGGGGPHRL